MKNHRELFVVETVCPERRDDETLSNPFSRKERAEEYAADLVNAELSEMYTKAEGRAREIQQYLHDKNWAGAVELWNEYAEETSDSLPRFNINTEWLDRDVLRTPLKIPAPPIAQDEISEGINIVDDEAHYRGEMIAQAPRLFMKLRAKSAYLGSPRIFSVNDHGNVTEWSYSGRVIGEWV